MSKLRARMQSLRSQSHPGPATSSPTVRPADPGAASDLASSAEDMPSTSSHNASRAQDAGSAWSAVKIASTTVESASAHPSNCPQTELAWDRRFRQVRTSERPLGTQPSKLQPSSDTSPAPMDAVSAEQALLQRDARNIAQVKWVSATLLYV